MKVISENRKEDALMGALLMYATHLGIPGGQGNKYQDSVGMTMFGINDINWPAGIAKPSDEVLLKFMESIRSTLVSNMVQSGVETIETLLAEHIKSGFFLKPEDTIWLNISTEDEAGIREFSFAVKRDFLMDYLGEDESLDDFLHEYTSDESTGIYAIASLNHAVLAVIGDNWFEDE